MLAKEPIAIVGMACRFPGGANDPSLFWKLLRDGIDAITEVPEQRWNASRFHHANAGAPGRMVTRWGGFVDNADMFDAAFFGIAPREAARMDPQQRWLAEVTWEAIEDAALPPEQLTGTRTGVFLGISSCDYATLVRKDVWLLDGYVNLGSALCIAANRLSYLFNFRGPSFAVDTACSSSLVALHLAAQSLWSGECDYAVVAAANELITPEASIGLSHAGMLSPRGRCRAFDASADGYVRAEGAAAILLMPARAAEAMRVQARALLITTVSNQDGRSSSLTVPNQQAQEEMLREALQSANARPQDVIYVEAHGTGTPVGDPIEARALAAVFCEGRGGAERLLVGSVKTNIGHLESASGLAGLIKTVLVLEQRTVPPNLHFETPNSLLPVDRLQIPTALMPLPGSNGSAPLVAVNSFGFGGSNAHALLSPAPAQAPAVEAPSEPCIFPFSARIAGALTDYAQAFVDLIAENEPASFSLRDLCASAALGKSHHPLRDALVANSLAGLQEQLVSFGKSAGTPQPAPAHPQIAFIFSGQGPQWWAMGRQLYESESIVRDMWERCDAICRKLGGPNLLQALLATEADSQMSRTDMAQPALFALQAGLVELWRAWGIEADIVIGHSVGEAAAAWAAGIFGLEEIFRVIIARSRWQQKMHGLGRMLAAAISANDAQEWERKFAGRVCLAAINAPQQITLSGETNALEEIATALKEAEVFCRFLPTDYAFHSAQMDVVEKGLRWELSGIEGSASQIAMISTVTGEPVQGPELNADYWWRNIRQPVRFAAGIEQLLRSGCTTLVEIGPHPVMASALAEIALTQKSSITAVASLRRAEDERGTMLHGLATLYRRGADVRWEALYTRPARAVRLPAYPWQRQRLWHEAAETERHLRSVPPHPLLGDRQPDPQPTWLNHLDARLVPWLADHRLAASAVFPAAAYLEMAAVAVRELLGEPTIYLEDVRFHQLLFLPDQQPIPTCLRLDPIAASFQIFAAPTDAPSAWKIHAEGLYRPGRLHIPPTINLEQLRDTLTEEHDPQKLYRALSAIGQVYGPTFQGLASLRLRGNEALAELTARGDRDSTDYLLFPPTLDACFHPAALYRQTEENSRVVVLGVRQLRLFQPLLGNVWSHLRVIERSQTSFVTDLTIYNENGAVLAQVDGLSLRTIDSDTGYAQRERKFYQLAWESAPAAENREAAVEEVLIFCDQEGFGVELAKSLKAQEISPTLIFADKNYGGNGSGLAVDLRQKGWAAELWKNLAARGPIPPTIIYLWSWGDQPPPDQRACSSFFALAQARLTVAGCDDPARWLVVTRMAQAAADGDRVAPGPAALWGFVRTLQTEQPQWRVSLVDCADAASYDSLLGELFVTAIEPEVAFRDDTRLVRRMRQFQPRSARIATNPPAYSLEIGQPGRMDSLEFHGHPRAAPGPREVEIEIAAAGLNFRDVMKALGIYPLKLGERPIIGGEFSGRVVRVGRAVRKLKSGDRVMGTALAEGAFSSHLVLSAEFVWKIPADLSFADAGSIPVVFGTAYHALHNLARLRCGETVLIHAAAGGVGLAAVQLAQQVGAIVLATAGNDEKRAFLHSLGVALVMDSRTLDFADETMRYTAGRGVNVVLNSLAGAFQQKSLAICAPQGRFVEIGKRDLYENKGLPLAAFQRALSFFTFDLTSALTCRGTGRNALVRFLGQGFRGGRLKPIQRTTFPARDAVSAFRLMRSAQHIGKIVLEFDANDPPEVRTEFWPDPEATYLVTGGLSGFGLATARWLVDRGAMHLALISRRGQPSPRDLSLIERMRARGVLVVTLSADVADAKILGAALRRLNNSAPPLRGVFHAAMVLRDRLLAEMTEEDLQAVLAPKITGAWNLHLQTREMPLDCFVLFSSLSSLIGSPGQANYAAANAFLDALAHHRRAEGLAGLSVNWGQISDVGVVADRPEVGRYLDQIGVRALSSKDALATLGRLMASAEAQAGVMNVDWDRLTLASAKYGTSPIFRDLVEAQKANRIQDHGANEWRATVLRLPREEQLAAVSDLIVAQLAATFGMTPGEIDRTRPLAELGLDSLMAVELKARIESHAGYEMPFNIFNADLTTERMAERFWKQMSQSVPELRAPIQTRPAPGGTAERVPPFLRMEPARLVDRIREGKLEPLAAAALMSWPGIMLAQFHLSPEEFFQRMSGGRVSLDLILETPLGSVGIFMLPLTGAQVNPGEPSLLPHLLDGITQASACGARCVALTSLFPSATNYGATVQEACAGRSDLAGVTTGHATTIAAVILNLEALLRQAGRVLVDETVMFYGIGSIGLGVLRLMLDVLPHPAALHLCDPYRSAQYFAELEETLRCEYRYDGKIRVVRSGSTDADEVFEASVIVGATNVEDVIDVARLAPGTLIVDDSWPHCMNGPAAFARFEKEKDILFTEGGFVRNRAPMRRIAHVPAGAGIPAELPQLLFSSVNPHDITACILSALLSARKSELPPTIGLVDPGVVQQHWAALAELGFAAAELNYEGTALSPDRIVRFRSRFGKEVSAPQPVGMRLETSCE